jgi:uncharacterized membrane protein
MYDFLLITHFFGLAIGAGTPFYLAALAAHAGKSGNPLLVKSTMLGSGGAILRVGSTGLGLLIITGILMLMLSNTAGQVGWQFHAKMVAVVLITLHVINMMRLLRKARREEGMASMATIKKLAPAGPLLSLAIIVLAVMAFH